jgi:splicing factor 3B subunit 3
VRTRLQAVGGYDNTVRVLSLEMAEPLKQASVQAMPSADSQPRSLCLANLTGVAATGAVSASSDSSAPANRLNGMLRSAQGTAGEGERLFLYIGLANGVMIRSLVDHTGSLSDMRKKCVPRRPRALCRRRHSCYERARPGRFLGTKPVQLFTVVVGGKDAVLALSSRAWLSYVYQTRLAMAALSYEVRCSRSAGQHSG